MRNNNALIILSSLNNNLIITKNLSTALFLGDVIKINDFVSKLEFSKSEGNNDYSIRYFYLIYAPNSCIYFLPIPVIYS